MDPRGLPVTRCEACVSTDNEHLSLPRLYGAPAHTPRRMVSLQSDAPMGPDDLPIETSRSAEDTALALQLMPRSYGGHAVAAGPAASHSQDRGAGRSLDPHSQPHLTGRPLFLRALTGRLLRPKGN